MPETSATRRSVVDRAGDALGIPATDGLGNLSNATGIDAYTGKGACQVIDRSVQAEQADALPVPAAPPGLWCG